jgi:hypothetical protein
MPYSSAEPPRTLVEKRAKDPAPAAEEYGMAEKTQKTVVTGELDLVRKSNLQYHFRLTNCDSPDFGQTTRSFLLSEKKALLIANEDECFPLRVRVKVSGRVKPGSPSKLTHVNIVSVDGVEMLAWSQRCGSSQQKSHVLKEAEQRIKEAQEAEEAMVNRAPPEQPGAITDPLEAYEKAMRIIRMQRRLKNPKLSQQEIWQVRDALNLLAEKLGIG